MDDDPFALLGEPRRPLADEARLKARYHELTASLHPDITGEAGDFARINLAYQTLSDPRARLRALLELEGAAPAARHQAVPEEIATLFPVMSENRRKLDAFLRKRAAATSALARAMLLDEAYQLADEGESWLATLEEERNRWLETIATCDTGWDAGERPLQPLAEVVQALGYLDKWIAQIREGVLRLQFAEVG